MCVRDYLQGSENGRVDTIERISAGLSFIYVLPFELQVLRGEDPINKFNPATILCMSEVRTWISNVICRGPLFVFSEWMWELIVRFVDIGGIVDHRSLFKLSFHNLVARSRITVRHRKSRWFMYYDSLVIIIFTLWISYTFPVLLSLFIRISWTLCTSFHISKSTFCFNAGFRLFAYIH